MAYCFDEQTLPLLPVTNLYAFADLNEITVTWAASEHAEGYIIHRQAPGESEMSYYAEVWGETQFLETVDIEGEYIYRVYPYRTFTEGEPLIGYSEEVATAYFIVPLTAVTNLKITATRTSANLTWDALDNADGYIIYRQAPGEENMSLFVTVTGADYSDTVASPGFYFYRVYPYRILDGQQIQGPSDAYVYTRVTMEPAPVTNLRVTAVGNVARLRWTASPDAEDYIIFRQAPGETTMSYLYLVTGAGFNDTVTTPGYYFYRVYPRRIIDGKPIVGKSDTYVYTNVTMEPAPVTNLRVTSVGKTAQLRWTASPDADSYIIYRRAPGETEMTYRYLVTNPGFNDTVTTPGYYFYRVYPRRVLDGNPIVGKSDKYVYTNIK